jgi:hypothetical protein
VLHRHTPIGNAEPSDWTIWVGELTLPWDVPPKTIVVEFVDGRWRVVPHGRMAVTFATREAALCYAQRIAALFDPVWRIVERPEPLRRATA